MELGEGTAFRVRMLPWYRSCIRSKAAPLADSNDPAPRRHPHLRFSDRCLPNPSLQSGFFFPAPGDVCSLPESKKKPPCLARVRASELENRLMGEGVLIRPARHFRRLSGYLQD